MTRNWLKPLAALAFLGAMGLATTMPAQAQGVYFEGPGFDVGVGAPWHHHHYYYGPYHHRWHDRYYYDED
ncbi:MAG TPA: hypothetical protein VKX28_06200 [Xanthobacteraceae bacterium]|jgi:hypothetical protein|nr:hypothetical protein [Xanthobacteraceae bacterium]